MNKIFNGTVLVFVVGAIMDVMIGYWIVKRYDVVPDQFETWVINLF